MLLNQTINLILSNIKTRKTQKEKEDLYYNNISQSLNEGKLEDVKQLFEWSIELDINLIPSKIPDLSEILSNLLVKCIHNLDFGEIFLILRFCNEYNLFEKNLNPLEYRLIQSCYDDEILMKNLKDLFGDITQYFIAYLRTEMPKNLYRFYKTLKDIYEIDVIMSFLDRYVMYGLSVQNLGDVRNFLRRIEEHYSDSNYKFEKFIFHNITHLICPKVLLEMKEKIISKNYNFFNLSMITSHGIGPQGLGFTYSTPRREIIEICSDRKENEAIIIKFKQFLSNKFVKELTSELAKYSVNEIIIRKISRHLINILNDDKVVGYFIKL